MKLLPSYPEEDTGRSVRGCGLEFSCHSSYHKMKIGLLFSLQGTRLPFYVCFEEAGTFVNPQLSSPTLVEEPEKTLVKAIMKTSGKKK